MVLLFLIRSHFHQKFHFLVFQSQHAFLFPSPELSNHHLRLEGSGRVSPQITCPLAGYWELLAVHLLPKQLPSQFFGVALDLHKPPPQTLWSLPPCKCSRKEGPLVSMWTASLFPDTGVSFITNDWHLLSTCYMQGVRQKRIYLGQGTYLGYT